jgi:hypothetical protein
MQICIIKHPLLSEVQVKMSASSMFGSAMTSESILKPKYTNNGDEPGFVAFTPNLPVRERESKIDRYTDDMKMFLMLCVS